jgi:UDP-N-acetylmuramate--alanine ligase
MNIQPNLLLPRHNLLEILGEIPSVYLHVDSYLQQMSLIKDNFISKIYPVSTSLYGIGNQEGSFKTPPGLHIVIEKIGADAPLGRIFKDRLDTGVDWNPQLIQENLILTRILRLKGLQPGVNSGPGIDSFERYIYIHGTGHESEIGKPHSHGCVCMKNIDIIELFDLIAEGTFVTII